MFINTVNAQKAEKTQDIIEALKDHESEFFDWLERWIKLKGVGRYDSATVY